MIKNIFLKLLNLVFKKDDNVLFYLSNDKALPQALTEEAEQNLIAMLDSNPEYAKQQLNEHN